MSNRIPLSSQELLDYSREHVIYELWMFRAVGQALAAPLQMSAPLRNLIESFVIHLRNLVDFFYPAQVQGDDVVAAEFSDDITDWEKRSLISPMLAAARVRAHKEVSHLTRKEVLRNSPGKRLGNCGVDERD